MLNKLWIILALALVLRISMINKVPPELFGDEIDVGYQSYSLLKTGRDLYNQTLPFYIKSLAEFRAPLLMYATVPSVAIFGLNEYGVRLPEVIFGTLGVLVFGLLVYQTIKSKNISILSSLSLSISPWHIMYSRSAFEVVLMLDLIMLGTVLFFRKKFTICFLLFALSMYTYSTAVVFVPLLITFLCWKNVWKIKKYLLFFGVCLIPLLISVIGGEARLRFNSVGIFGNRDLIDQTYEMKNQSGLPSDRFFYNKYVQVSNLVISNYLKAFSPEFLFVRGDPVMRHSVQVSGGLLPTMAVFFVVGIYLLAKNKQWFWLIWLVLAPIPSALTYDGANHATRLFLMLPPLCLAVALGIIKLGRSKLLLSIIYFLIFMNLIWVSYYYVNNYSKVSWQWWHVGFKQVMQQLSWVDSQYVRVFINNTYEPSLERFLFWNRYSPDKFHKNFMADKWIDEIAPGYNGFKLGDKYYFGDFSDKIKTKGINNILRNDSLYIISQRENVAGDWDWWKNPPDGVKVLSVSRNSFGKPIFYLVTGK